MSPISPTPSHLAPAGPGRRAPDDPDEAARQFEAVLVRQFVEVMTKDLFQSEEGGMLTGQADLQRDTLTDTLTDHLVESGTFGIADLMVAQWERAGRVPTEPPEGDAAAPPTPSTSPERPALTMDEALRRYQPAQGPSVSIDPTDSQP